MILSIPFASRHLKGCALFLALALPLLAQEKEPEIVPPTSTKAPDAAPEAESAFETWLGRPSDAPAPPREDLEKYLSALQQRQQDIGKILAFLVQKKRMRKESAAKEEASVAIPGDLTMEHWDELARLRKEGSLSEGDYTAGLTAIAGKLRALNLAQETLSHKCAELMLRQTDEIPVRRAHAVNEKAAVAR